VVHRGRTELAMDCALAGAEAQHGRPLNLVVRRHGHAASIVIRAGKAAI